MPSPTKIAVVGSLNIDYFTTVGQFPQPGETVTAGELDIRFGGKGANQAVAASRLGAQVEMIGCLGDDEMGRQYLERLGEFGIGAAGVKLVGGAATGSAFITVDARAENTIVVAPGANHHLSAEQVEAQAGLIAGADCLLLQNEVPADANSLAMAIARANRTQIFYNPAPWRDGFSIGANEADYLIVNETEAARLLGHEVSSQQQLSELSGIVVTCGAQSTLANAGGRLFAVAPPRIEPVDTVGAGDTFVGALAVFAASGAHEFAEALRLANTAAALSTKRVGAQEAMPSMDEVVDGLPGFGA